MILLLTAAGIGIFDLVCAANPLPLTRLGVSFSSFFLSRCLSLWVRLHLQSERKGWAVVCLDERTGRSEELAGDKEISRRTDEL